MKSWGVNNTEPIRDFVLDLINVVTGSFHVTEYRPSPYAKFSFV